jgi:hypothetical protein
MDPALLKERNAFLNRAKAQPAVEKRKRTDAILEIFYLFKQILS